MVVGPDYIDSRLRILLLSGRPEDLSYPNGCALLVILEDLLIHGDGAKEFLFISES